MAIFIPYPAATTRFDFRFFRLATYEFGVDPQCNAGGLHQRFIVLAPVFFPSGLRGTTDFLTDFVFVVFFLAEVLDSFARLMAGSSLVRNPFRIRDFLKSSHRIYAPRL